MSNMHSPITMPRFNSLPLFAIAIALTGFGLQPTWAGDPIENVDVPSRGVAVLMPTKGNNAIGTVLLEQQGENVKLVGKVINLSSGEKGFHIHKYGDLRAADGTSAGGHYAPSGNPHGAPGDAKHHAGDLGNITAGDDGVAEFEVVAKNQKLHTLFGRAIVVHGGADDFTSQPSGAAGPRVALGVIGIMNPEASAK